jgi:thioredoxin 1
MKNLLKKDIKEKKLIDKIEINCKPAVVLVKAEWSGASHIMDMILNKIEKEFSHKIKIIRIDLESHKDLLRSFGVESVPAMLLINKGQIVEVIKETLSQKTLGQVIQNLIQASDSLERNSSYS